MNIELIKKILTEKKATLPSLRKLELTFGIMWKAKQIITKYPNEQHHWTEQVSLCWSKINLLQNRCASKELEQKYKIPLGN